jgi:hypothetical protein
LACFPCCTPVAALAPTFAEEHLLNVLVKAGQPPLAVRVREVDVLVRTGGYDVELGVEHVDAVDHPVEPRHCKSGVALVLPHRRGLPSNLL